MVNRAFHIATVALTTLLLAGSLLGQDPIVVSIPEDKDALEFVGQFNNTKTASQQFGYLSKILDLSPIFTDPIVQNETTALFTFVTNASTDRVILNGPFKIINRSGTTIVYLNTPPSDFSNPATFSQGTPIQWSNYTQQVVLDTVTGRFTTVHMNKVTQTAPFVLNGNTYQLGRIGTSFRTNYLGAVNTLAPPSGWFGGHAVGVRGTEED